MSLSDSRHPAPDPTGFRERGYHRAPLLLLAGALVGSLATLLLGSTDRTIAARHRARSPYAKLAVFARVLHYVETDYVDPIDHDAAIDNAIRGLLRGLDPHTLYFSARQVKLLRSALTGRYVGVGLTLTRRRGKVIVLGVETGSPAAKAGVLPGDRLLSIDGVSVAPYDVASLTLRLRGRRSTRIVLVTRRPGKSHPRRLAMVRDVVRQVDVLKASLPGKIGYIVVRRFSRGVTRAVRRALRSLQRAQPGGLRGLILDLRDNPGGLMDESVRLADLFVSKGILINKIGKRGRLHVREMAHPARTVKKLPVVVLVNGGTASAAEVVAGSLADHHRALLVGSRTFGKGSMQSVIPLPDGSRLKLTIARYFRPSGRPIDRVGIQPDVRVPLGGHHPPVPPQGALLAVNAPVRGVSAPLLSWIRRDPVLVRAMRRLVPPRPR